MIRKFESKDLPEVMNIWLSANIDAHSFISPDYWQSQFDTVKGLIPQAEVYISENGGIVNGFIGMIDNDIAGIFVNKSYRASGIGTELLNTAKAHKNELALSVYVKNETAIRFYEKAGFHVAEHKTDAETNEDEYTMIWERRRGMTAPDDMELLIEMLEDKADSSGVSSIAGFGTDIR